MSYAILQISAAAYDDIRGRLVALDERTKADPSYAGEYISAPGILGRPERLVFGPVAFERLPEEPVSDLADALIETECRDAADLVDMAHVGKALLDAIADVTSHGRLKGWAPADSPVEIVTDLVNMLDEATTKPVTHVDDMNDAVLVGMALEDDARALHQALYDDGLVPFGDPTDLYSVEVSGNIVNLVALARVLRRRYLTAEKEAVLLAAARWKALLAAATSALGSAGLEWGVLPGTKQVSGTATPRAADKGYMHAGINFHTQASPGHLEGNQPKLAAAILTCIADQVIAQGGEAWAMKDGVRVDPEAE